MELLDPPEGAEWGCFNDRPLDMKAVKELVEAFKGNVDNCTESTAIDVTLRRGWLDERSKPHDKIEGMKIEEVSELLLNEKGAEAARNDKVLILGGFHRREAVKLYVAAKQKERKTTGRQLDRSRARAKASEGGEEGEQDPKAEEAAALSDALKKLDEEIAKASRWVVRIYDRGKRA